MGNLIQTFPQNDNSDCMKKGIDYVTAGQKSGTTLGANATAEGLDTTASSEQAHAEGKNTVASGSYSHAEGEGCTAYGIYAHAEGWHTNANSGCHAEGSGSNASSAYSHAEGVATIASDEGAHAEGYVSQATKKGSHSENRAYAQGEFSHAEGLFSKTKAAQAHAEGTGTLASSESQHVQGKYNVEDANGIYAHIVGNGTNSNSRSNIHTLDWSGNAWFAGDVTDGSGNVLSDKANSDDVFGSKSATGNPIIIEDSANAYAEEVIANIEPIQDLHGYDHPWVGGAGKNILPLTDESIKTASGVVWSGDSATFTGITWTINKDTDGNVIGITLNGTPTVEYSQITIARLDIDPGTYTFSGISDGSSETWWVRYVARDSSGTAISIGGSVFIDIHTTEVTRTLPSNVSYINAYIGTRVTISNKTFKPMIRLSTETDPTFEPYSNICPISGLDNVEVKRTGKNLLPMTVDGIKSANTSGTWSGNAYTLNGVTFTIQIDADGNVIGINVNGTATANTQLFVWHGTNIFNGYKLNTSVTGSSNSTYFASFALNHSPWTENRCYNEDITLELANDDTVYLFIYIVSNATISNKVFYPMIRLATETDSTFEPYQSETHTTSLSQTTYGGTLNVQTGELVVDKVCGKFTSAEYYGLFGEDDAPLFYVNMPANILKYRYTLDSQENKLYSNLYNAITTDNYYGLKNGEIRTQDVYFYGTRIYIRDDRFTSKSEIDAFLSQTPVQIVGKLYSPQTYHLTPEQVKLLKGYNYITTNSDTLDITYQVDNVLGEILSESEEYTNRVVDDLGTASKKDVETTLTNDENLPTGNAVIDYLNSNITTITWNIILSSNSYVSPFGAYMEKDLTWHVNTYGKIIGAYVSTVSSTNPCSFEISRSGTSTIIHIWSKSATSSAQLTVTFSKVGDWQQPS